MEESVTVRIPQEILNSAKRLSSSAGESLNDFVVLALERELRWRQGWAAHERIMAINKQLPPQPDATELIRQLREGEGRYD